MQVPDRFKFRAWDGNRMWIEGEMNGYEYYRTTMDKSGTRWVFERCRQAVASSERGDPLMQSTGLADKNGVEIFEGDLVVTYDNEAYRVDTDGNELFNVPPSASTRWAYRCGDSQGRPETVEFDTESLCYSALMDGSWDGMYLEDMDYVEVVGNIYENPELLT